MITYGNSGLSSETTRSGRSLLYIDVIRNGETYKWAVYIPAGENINTWLTANASVIEQDIVRKEALWATSPHTEEIIDMDGNTVTVDIPKSRIVCPTIPDYEEIASDPVIDIKSIKRLLQLLTTSLLASETITQQQISDLTVIHDYWVVGKAYKMGDVCDYNGKLYKIVQPHTSQADWLPSDVPALYVMVIPPDVIPVFVQPTGAHDVYMKGDKVRFPDVSSPAWESLIDNNSWSPVAYPAGWEML